MWLPIGPSAIKGFMNKLSLGFRPRLRYLKTLPDFSSKAIKYGGLEMFK